MALKAYVRPCQGPWGTVMPLSRCRLSQSSREKRQGGQRDNGIPNAPHLHARACPRGWLLRAVGVRLRGSGGTAVNWGGHMGLPDREGPCAETRTHMQTQALLVAGAGPWVSNSTGAFLCEALLNFLWRPASRGGRLDPPGTCLAASGHKGVATRMGRRGLPLDRIPSGLTIPPDLGVRVDAGLGHAGRTAGGGPSC